MTEKILFRTATADEMLTAGIQFAESLREGDLVALSGELGAGKTHLCPGSGVSFRTGSGFSF